MAKVGQRLGTWDNSQYAVVVRRGGGTEVAIACGEVERAIGPDGDIADALIGTGEEALPGNYSIAG